MSAKKRRTRGRPPTHYNPLPRFGLRLYVEWVSSNGRPRRFVDSGEATRRFQRFLGGAHVQIDGWGYP